VPSGNIQRMRGQMQQRQYEFNASQDGMAVMAEDTGGLFFRGTNDITGALAAAVSDQEEYYLVSFRPDDETFEKSKNGAAKYHKLEVKVKRPGVKVRFRKGFYGVTDEERTPEKRPLILTAMMSPFKSVEVPLRLTPILRLEHSKEVAGVLRALIHMDISGFQFQDLPDQRKECELEAAVYLFDLEGKVVDNLVKTYKIALAAEPYKKAIANGLLQQIEVGISKPGNYQIRAAVRDTATNLAGSAVQFIQVPDITKQKLETSDLIVAGEGWEKGTNDHSGPGERRMRQGELVKYNLLLYNTKLGPDRKPKLEMQTTLYRDGKIVHRGPLTSLELKDQKDGESLTVSGSFKLGTATAVGEYVLEVAIRDLLAPKKEQYAVRSSSFEVIP
jgi:hypothetical protein